MSYSFKFMIVILSSLLFAYVYQKARYILPKMDGHSDYELRDIAQIFKKHVENNIEMGSSFVVYFQDRKVLDFLSGYADLEFEIPWSQNTITHAYGLSPISVSLSAALLLQRGVLQLEDSLSKYIPGFQKDITVRHLMTHTLGLPSFDQNIHLAMFRDEPEKLCQLLTKQKPYSKLRGIPANHLFTQSIIFDCLIKNLNIKQKMLRDLFHDEIAYPLGADLLIGLPRSQVYRLARPYHRWANGLLEGLAKFDGSYLRTIKAYPFHSEVSVNASNIFLDYALYRNGDPELNEIPLAGSHLFGNARGMARLMALVANSGKLNSLVLFNGTAYAALTSTGASGFDEVLQRNVTYSNLGLQIESSPKGTTLIGMRDSTGQMAFADVENKLSFAYLTNHNHHITPNRNSIHSNLIEAVYNALDAMKQKQSNNLKDANRS